MGAYAFAYTCSVWALIPDLNGNPPRPPQKDKKLVSQMKDNLRLFDRMHEGLVVIASCSLVYLVLSILTLFGVKETLDS